MDNETMTIGENIMMGSIIFITNVKCFLKLSWDEC